MKRLVIVAAAIALAACSGSKLNVEVNNSTDVARTAETVQVVWSEIESKGISPENVVVTLDGEQIPSQVIYGGGEEPMALIFQCDMEPYASKEYVIARGEREQYPIKVSGRQVPERLDDYAWENDKAAYRAYGPALETAPGEMLATPGFDVWVKSVDTLVVDARYKRGNYHHNYGDGMDCYKVGKTLGGGASAPFINDTLWLSRNYTTYQTLENGPIRTSVKLTYAPFKAGDKQVSLTKIITLDAGSYFNCIENIYSGDFDKLPVAAGFIRHNVKALSVSENNLSFMEEASDTKQPEVDGDIYFGVILPGAEFRAEEAGHAVAIASATNGESLVYYAGSGWSNGDIIDMPHWMAIVEQATASILTPLEVTIK